MKFQNKKPPPADHGTKELEQEKNIFEGINELLSNKTEELEKTKRELEVQLSNEVKKSKEQEQEKMIIGEMVQNEEKKNIQLSRKHVLTIVGFIVAIGIITTAYSLFVVELGSQEYRVPNTSSIQSSYVIENLRGDTIDTWLSWRLVDGTILHVNVIGVNNAGKLDLIKEVVLSQEDIEIDDSLLHKGPKGTTSTYYTGWTGALSKAAEDPTEFYLPNKLEVIESPKGEGDITIRLTDERSGDGYSGFTKSIADESQHQILKSEITIYEVNKLSDEQFKTILRHEFGHAVGLAHSSDPEDLMHATIQTEYPYISECDIDAVKALYDGKKTSQVVCEK